MLELELNKEYLNQDGHVVYIRARMSNLDPFHEHVFIDTNGYAYSSGGYPITWLTQRPKDRLSRILHENYKYGAIYASATLDDERFHIVAIAPSSKDGRVILINELGAFDVDKKSLEQALALNFNLIGYL